MFDDVPVFGAPEFFGQSFRRIARHLALKPFDEDFSFGLGRLFLILRGHVFEKHRFICIAVERFQIDRIDGLKLIQADITLLFVNTMARIAMLLHDLHRLVLQDGGVELGLRSVAFRQHVFCSGS